ncbi:DUF2793 domain-containing protein [Siculibacillus lacustris]|uniref:DUF2793 domain-containing protein n=1 Tax=Siculibacillus lacustris TaxID=1549641 RepID=A0A4Q9VZ93_9HYPH|nr:DUF2793 domain-containing protein [Siculibacillus lacustris]TBW40979.1 DUF2793 domain-containing protein [Siculibacillus lacustris]
MSTTPRLGLPVIEAAQAQKHVTHNETLRRLDALVQPVVAGRGSGTPPAAPDDGAAWIVGSSPTGAWAGRVGAVAVWDGGAWDFLVPALGWQLWVADEHRAVVWTGTTWVPTHELVATFGNLAGVGIGTTPDAVNRLHVRAPAALFEAEPTASGGSGDLRFVLSKDAAARTASLLFQDAFSGRAEIGLAGDDDLHVKVSSDGSVWRSALTIDRATGKCAFGRGTPTDWLTVDNPAGNTAYAQTARFNVWNNADGSQATRVVFAQQAYNTFLVEVADQANVKGNWMFQPYGGAVGLRSWRTAATPIALGGTTAPDVDNSLTLGTAALRWATIYAANGTINTSDARDKIIVGGLGAIAGNLIDAVDPILFRWRIGGIDVVETGEAPIGRNDDGSPILAPTHRDVPRPGVRLHAGFRAQDLKAAMDALDVEFGAWGLDDKADPQSRQWLRPDQLIPVLWAELRALRARVRALEAAAAADRPRDARPS